MPISTNTGDDFTGQNLESLRSKVLRKLRAGDTTRYSPSKGSSDYTWIDEALNTAQDNFVEETACLRGYAVIKLKNGYRSYRLPPDYIDLLAAYYYDATLTYGYKELAIKATEQMNDEYSDYRTATGEPSVVYVDRMHGNNWIIGVYKIPSSDGEAFTFDTDYGVVIDWVCPAYTFGAEYGTFVRIEEGEPDEYLMNTDAGVVAQISSMEKNMYIEYYKSPLKMSLPSHYPEIPRKYHENLCDEAASILLFDNPEASTEIDRASVLHGKFKKAWKLYNSKRKKPIQGRELKVRAASQSWVKDMEWYKGIP